MCTADEYRRTNLIAVMGELEHDGIDDLAQMATVLGITAEVLSKALHHGAISEQVAREIEWAMGKRHGWMDDDPSLADAI